MKVLHINCADYGSTGAIIDSIAKYSNFEHVLCAPYITKQHEKLKTYSVCVPHELGVYKRIAYVLGYQYGFAPVSTLKIKRIIEKENPNVIHIHSANCNVVNIYSLLRFLKQNKIPFIITNHAEFFYTGSCSHAFNCEKWKSGCGNCPQLRFAANTWRDTTANAWQKMKKAFAGAKQCYVVSVSPWQKKRALESPIFSGVQQRCIMNGIDASIFYEKRFLKEDDWRTVLFVTADFSTTDKYSKGGFYLLELARLLKNEKIRFEVVGRTASKKVEEDNVRIIGPVHDKNELADFYCKADVALALSQRETYGMTVAEALLCGTPVVGFKNGGSESIALSNHTQFVEFGDVKKLADIIRNKWIDYKDIHSNQIALEAEYMYSDKAMATAYENLYLEVIK